MLLGATTTVPQTAKDPIYIAAKHAEIVTQGHYAVYTGQVVVQCQQHAIHASEVTVYEDEAHAIKKIIATGKPVRYYHANNQVRGSAKQLTYLYQDQKLILSGNAALNSKKASFKAPSINYDLQTQTVDAAGNNNARQQVILYPQ